jgi:hypothetical protein
VNAQGYRRVSQRGKKKKKIIHNEMMQGHRRDNLSEADMDFIMGAEWTYSFETPRSTMVKTVQYDPKRWLMRVNFVNRDDIVVYDHVPAETYFFLEQCAKREGKIGHVFWENIRYPGQLINSKYTFWYESKGTAANAHWQHPWMSKLSEAQADAGYKETRDAVGEGTELAKDMRARAEFDKAGGLLGGRYRETVDEQIENRSAEASKANVVRAKDLSHHDLLTEIMKSTRDKFNTENTKVSRWERVKQNRAVWKREDGPNSKSVFLPRGVNVKDGAVTLGDIAGFIDGQKTLKAQPVPPGSRNDFERKEF